jgi:hypothetical protein
VPEKGDKMSAKINLRSNFAIHHMRAAVRDALAAHAVEQANDTTIFGPWFDDMMMSVPVAIIMSAAALEANSREIIQDRIDQLETVQPPPPLLKGLKGLSTDSSGGAMEKYKKLAALLGKSVNVTSPTWEDAALLFKFRNKFVHFTPAWDHETKVHDGDIVKDLKGKVPVSPAYQSVFMFPYGFLTYGCAKWAVETARNFASDFSVLVGVKDRFAGGSALP